MVVKFEKRLNAEIRKQYKLNMAEKRNFRK